MTDIFISYSHKDEKWKDALQDHLLVLQNHGEFSVWDDRQIKLGDDWYPAITDAIEAARVVVLLISADFLKSDFVRNEEIPKFLKRRAEDGLRVIPLIVRPCPWQAVPWLAELQGGTKDNFPLSRFEPESYELEEAISGFVVKVNALLQASKHEEEQARLKVAAEKQAAERKAADAMEQARLVREREALQAKAMAEQEAAQLRKQQLIAQQLAEAQKVAQANREQVAAQSKSTPPPINEERTPDPQYIEPTGNRGISKKQRNVLVLSVAAALIASGFWFNSQKSTTNVSEAPAGPAISTPAVIETTETPEKPPESPKRFKFEPEMVTIPAGTFTMGCLDSRDNVEGGCFDNEKPAHDVKIASFQMGKYEVTYDEWDACTDDGHCIKADDAGWGRGQRPVINVSWDDIQAYKQWLNQKTGKQYRLPTEAEWEYAARAGSDTAFPWGNKISCDQANYNVSCVGKTVEVNRYQANAFGLYNTSGNVWEWVADCWKGSYQGASATGQAQPDCASSQGQRVLRGGSWDDFGGHCRSAFRIWYDAADRNDDVGFRLSLGL